MLSFSIPLIPFNLSYWLKDSLDRLILSGISQLYNTGIYQIAVSFGGTLNMGTQAFYTANTPRFFALLKDKSANEHSVIAVMPVSAACFSVLAFGMSLFAQEIISLLTTKNYHEAALYVPFVVTSTVVFLIYSNVVNVLYNHSATKIIAVISVGASLVSAALSFFLIKYLTILGAALSLICSNLILSLSFYFVAQHMEKMKWPLGKTLVLSLLPLLAIVVLRGVSGFSIIITCASKIVIIAAYSLGCFFSVKKEIKAIM